MTAGIPMEPSTFNEANKCIEWKKAMQAEIDALKSQGTWTLVPQPPNSKVTKTGLLDSKPMDTPIALGSLSLYDGDPLLNASEYHSIVGALQYCTFTRPGISYTVKKLCQFMLTPTSTHLQVAKRVLCYLKGTANYDWGSCPDDRRSTSVYCIFHGLNLISCSSAKQKVVSRSSTESEYRALANGASELSWLRSLIGELGLHS
ncbi:uncharacterized mitochondrial protein AtMg00810-like [Humulus lupulus]|uniref:uncharacterized mitochondrial protein AtMg00810-like n=1 Tax=Humulus lupulus TaxID=3486 RepID=UPI002B41745B|nr:uncharacterized mitochondrial protein AtMg00810-like [Humulus lupulus]